MGLRPAWLFLLFGALGCSGGSEQASGSEAIVAPATRHLGRTECERSLLYDRTPVSWATASETLRFAVGPIEEVPDESAFCLELPSGHVLASVGHGDRLGSSDVLWAWYLELERTAAGEWVPCSTLYNYAVGWDWGWCGEGHLRGSVTVDSREPRALRCRLELQAEQAEEAGVELADASVFFTADPEENSQELAEFLEAGTGKALGLNE